MSVFLLAKPSISFEQSLLMIPRNLALFNRMDFTSTVLEMSTIKVFNLILDCSFVKSTCH